MNTTGQGAGEWPLQEDLGASRRLYLHHGEYFHPTITEIFVFSTYF